MTKQPQKIITSGQEAYAPKKPGERVVDYDGLLNKPDLPEVPPPGGTGGDKAAAQAVFAQSGHFDPTATDVLKMIQGSKFSVPFTVTLMKRNGLETFKSDAGTKTEDKYELCKESIRDPGDLLRINAGIKIGAYKALNDNTLEFQFMMYLAAQHGVLA
jgi:hypothetical protein